MQISILILLRDNEKYIKYLSDIFTKIQSNYKHYILNFYIYENNSKDNTKECIKQFYKNKEGKYLSEDIPNCKKYKGIDINRGIYMANIRNKLKDFHGILDSDYTLILDSGIQINIDTIEQMINTINNNIVMVSTFCTYRNTKHYYDTFAFIKNDISYKKIGTRCIFNECNNCKRVISNKIDSKNFINSNSNNLVYVDSAFGCMSLIKTDIYNKVKWDHSICEHHSFCKNIKQFGEIVINLNIKTMMY